MSAHGDADRDRHPQGDADTRRRDGGEPAVTWNSDRPRGEAETPSSPEDIYSMPHDKERVPLGGSTTATLAVGRRDNGNDDGIVVKKSFPGVKRPVGFDLGHLYRPTPPLPARSASNQYKHQSYPEAIPLFTKHRKPSYEDEGHYGEIADGVPHSAKRGSLIADTLNGDSSHKIKVVVIDDSDADRVKKLTIDKEMNVKYSEFLKPTPSWRVCAGSAVVLACLILVCGLIGGLTGSSAAEEAWETGRLAASLDRSYPYLGGLGLLGWRLWQGESDPTMVTDPDLDIPGEDFLYESLGDTPAERSKRSATREREIEAGPGVAPSSGRSYVTAVMLQGSHDVVAVRGCGFMVLNHLGGAPVQINVTETSRGPVCTSSDVTLGDPINHYMDGVLVSVVLDLRAEAVWSLQPVLRHDGLRTYSIFTISSPCDILQDIAMTTQSTPETSDEMSGFSASGDD